MFEIAFTPTAANHIRTYRKFEQKMILDAIEEQLTYKPTVETRNRKRLGENKLSDWELRVEKYRVFYDCSTMWFLKLIAGLFKLRQSDIKNTIPCISVVERFNYENC